MRLIFICLLFTTYLSQSNAFVCRDVLKAKRTFFLPNTEREKIYKFNDGQEGHTFKISYINDAEMENFAGFIDMVRIEQSHDLSSILKRGAESLTQVSEVNKHEVNTWLDELLRDHLETEYERRDFDHLTDKFIQAMQDKFEFSDFAILRHSINRKVLGLLRFVKVPYLVIRKDGKDATLPWPKKFLHAGEEFSWSDFDHDFEKLHVEDFFEVDFPREKSGFYTDVIKIDGKDYPVQIGFLTELASFAVNREESLVEIADLENSYILSKRRRSWLRAFAMGQGPFQLDAQRELMERYEKSDRKHAFTNAKNLRKDLFEAMYFRFVMQLYLPNFFMHSFREGKRFITSMFTQNLYAPDQPSTYTYGDRTGALMYSMIGFKRDTSRSKEVDGNTWWPLISDNETVKNYLLLYDKNNELQADPFVYLEAPQYGIDTLTGQNFINREKTSLVETMDYPPDPNSLNLDYRSNDTYHALSITGSKHLIAGTPRQHDREFYLNSPSGEVILEGYIKEVRALEERLIEETGQ